MKTYVKPEIEIKSLATDEMLMTNYCGMHASDVVKASGQPCYLAAVGFQGGGQDDGIVRFNTGS